MKLWGDYHTHTTYTHGTGSVEDNVKVAISKGLKQIAITEHSFNHFAHAISRNNFEKLYNEVMTLREKYKQIDILLGIEANLISQDGDIDVPNDVMDRLDFVVLGYHKMFWTDVASFWNFLVPNTFRIGKASPDRIKKNTQAYINAMSKNKINIIAHPNYGNCTIDVDMLSKYAKEHNVYIELNGKRINFAPEDIQLMVQNGVMFVVNSDAHSPERVGRNDEAFTLIHRYNIPLSQIANMDKFPEYINIKER